MLTILLTLLLELDFFDKALYWGAGISISLWLVFKLIDQIMEDKQDKQDKENKIIEQIINTKVEIRDSKLELINNIEKLEIETDKSIKDVNNNNNEYNPIDAINKLQNILNDDISLNEKEKWDQLYDDSENPYKNILSDFKNKINKIGKIKEPIYYYDDEHYKIYKNTDYSSIRTVYNDAQKEIEIRIEKLIAKYEKQKDIWNNDFLKIEEKKSIRNNEIELLNKKYYQNDEKAIESFNKYILEVINYDRNFPKNIGVEYNPANKVLIVEYLLPSIDDFPKIKKRQYIKTRNEFKDIYFSDRELNKIFENTTYQIVLDIIKKVFVFDSIDQIKTVVFNGWSKSINKATGLINEACILSVSTNKDEFLKINLPEVDPKECFKGLKGISAHKISNLTPIKPIITINQNDKRFVSAHNVEVDSSTNLASMNWEDFEHLVREIFEKEFTSNGGNVKVTQSSRDGGVDAIAFDPDPIRGGKIVIQAKRYTNVVGVSAVRDLYGTVLNEGATKGILVTTSDYGSDSYNFAKDKPITLLNGSNLLHLLEKHNYKARINIKEAREEINNF